MHYYKANIFAIAFAQLQLFNKPFSICKWSSHSCVVVLEAVSGFLKCLAGAHLGIYNISEHCCQQSGSSRRSCPFPLPVPARDTAPRSCDTQDLLNELIPMTTYDSVLLSEAQGSQSSCVVRNP